MHKKALLKDTLREVRKSFGRFISIFLIVGIGVAFFAGVKASVPDMKGTADKYFDDYNLMDLRALSTIGMTKEDVEDLKQITGVEGVYGSHSMDVIQMRNNQQRVFKLMSMPLSANKNNKNYINQLRVVEGRLPEKADECVIENDMIKPVGLDIGDTITFESGTDEDLNESLKRTSFTIVGKVNTPFYLSYEKGSSTIGSGEINNYAIIPEENFKGKYFTEIFLTVDDAKSYNSYDDSYFDLIKPVTNKVTSVVERNVDERFEDIRQELLDKVEDGRKEYKKQESKFKKEIKKAEQKIEDGKLELKIGQLELDEQKEMTRDQFRDTAAMLRDKEAELSAGKREYEMGKATFEQKKKDAEAQMQKVEELKAPMLEKRKEQDEKLLAVEQSLQKPGITEIEKQVLEQRKKNIQGEITITQGIIDLLDDQVASGKAQLEAAELQLAQSKIELEAGEAQLEAGKKQLEAGKITAKNEFIKAQLEIEQGKEDLEAGEKELAKQKKDGQDQLKKAKEKIDQNEKDIKEMDGPDAYILDRHQHYSYMDYGAAADRMGAIAKVFPLFFFLVAALVCLTTMTRMVDEQRSEIGTLKALGYSKMDIALKYVLYASVASICGGIFGAVVGMIVFPTVIYNAWGIMYNMPEVQLFAQIPLAVTAIALSSVITVAAAVMACYKELVDVPSQLMRPKAPKVGKKILLERIPFIWKHFNFIHKVTARNIFRYKKRFLMTVIGISGCTALLVAGFGIQDSIGDIAVKQYQEIYQFDMSVAFDSDAKLSDKEKLIDEIKANDNVVEAMSAAVYHGLYADSGEDKGIDIYVPSDLTNFDDYIHLRHRKENETLPLSDDGAIITEKVAKMKGLSVGDTFEVDNGDGIKRKVKIADIAEHYVGHALYMTPTYYKEVYHRTPTDSTILAKLDNTSEKAEQSLGNSLMKEDLVNSVTFYSGIAASFEDTIASLSFIVVVLIISAGLLAFVVLYNLTNVNISERLREIATIKVLGFYDKEVSQYVYRENIILTLIGSFAGIFVGIGLHALIMSLAELETVMFGRNIYILSFVYAILITMVFAILVNLVMYRKLKNIPMVESLKSVE